MPSPPSDMPSDKRSCQSPSCQAPPPNKMSNVIVFWFLHRAIHQRPQSKTHNPNAKTKCQSKSLDALQCLVPWAQSNRCFFPPGAQGTHLAQQVHSARLFACRCYLSSWHHPVTASASLGVSRQICRLLRCVRRSIKGQDVADQRTTFRSSF